MDAVLAALARISRPGGAVSDARGGDPPHHQGDRALRPGRSGRPRARRGSRPASASSTTCSRRWRGTGCSTSRSRRRAISTSTATTRSRTPASRSAGDRPGAGRPRRDPALRRRRWCRSTRRWCARWSTSRAGRICSTTIEIPKWQMLGDYDVFLTPEFFRALVLNAGLTAHIDLVRGDNPAPHRRGGVQGVRPGARRRDGARPAGRGRAVHQGGAVIAVVDYGVNNLKSVVRALAAGGHAADAHRRSRRGARAPSGCCVPGVGNFGQGSPQPRGQRPGRGGARGRPPPGRPVMGICLGLQLFFETSEEAPGAREGSACCRAGCAASSTTLPVPHVGWARVDLTDAGRAPPDAGAAVRRRSAVLLPRAQLPPDRPAGRRGARHRRVRRGVPDASWGADTVIGAQFHPEKSQRAGIELLDAFARWRP